MTTRTKRFDCVAMKRKAQQALLAERQARHKDFDTLGEFIEAKLRESPWASEIWARFSSPQNAGADGHRG
jgi:hypothetical protein